MMTIEDFNGLVDRIQALGLREEIAALYASLIGDTPELADDEQTIVRDQSGVELARLRLEW